MQFTSIRAAACVAALIPLTTASAFAAVNGIASATGPKGGVRANVQESGDLNPQPLPPAGDTSVSNGNALYARGDFAGAAASFDKARQGNLRSAVALHNLALAHAKLGQKTLAVRELRQAVSLANASGDAVTANAAAKAIIIVGGVSR